MNSWLPDAEKDVDALPGNSELEMSTDEKRSNGFASEFDD